MKIISRITVLLVALASLAGCLYAPVGSRTVAIPPGMSNDEVFEVAIDAARAVGLPPVSSLSKANGTIDFGNFGMSSLGTTCMVRIRALGHGLKWGRVVTWIHRSTDFSFPTVG